MISRDEDIKVGDIVTRDGTDRHEVLQVDYDWGNMVVVCIKKLDSGWTQVGKTESNLIRRYSKVSEE